DGGHKFPGASKHNHARIDYRHQFFESFLSNCDRVIVRRAHTVRLLFGGTPALHHRSSDQNPDTTVRRRGTVPAYREPPPDLLPSVILIQCFAARAESPQAH